MIISRTMLASTGLKHDTLSSVRLRSRSASGTVPASPSSLGLAHACVSRHRCGAVHSCLRLHREPDWKTERSLRSSVAFVARTALARRLPPLLSSSQSSCRSVIEHGRHERRVEKARPVAVRCASVPDLRTLSAALTATAQRRTTAHSVAPLSRTMQDHCAPLCDEKHRRAGLSLFSALLCSLCVLCARSSTLAPSSSSTMDSI